MKQSDNNHLLLIDIGNTNTVFGIYSLNENKLLFHKRTVTHRDRTSDELGLFLKGFLREENFDPAAIHHAIYSSVVPSFNPIVDRMLKDYFGCQSMKVTFESRLPFTFKYPRPWEVGADRIVNASAATVLYPGKNIIIDMGTATTFCVLNEKPEYLGGVIAPGLKLSMDALTRNTAQLPPIIFQPTPSIIGNSTIESMQAGFYYGWIGLLEKIILKIREEFGNDYNVIGTGGLVGIIHEKNPDLFTQIDPHLTLRGLKVIYDLNA